ncbi:MAG TPA: hypothetical protein DCX06_01155 [Opitutae bacterium]|nr:hypothetical protein [Opitutae bacterium]
MNNDLLNNIQAVVDGNLSDPERHELLQELEREPRAYRQLALGFIEEQIIRDSFRAKQPAQKSSVHLATIAKIAALLAIGFFSAKLRLPVNDLQLVKANNETIHVHAKENHIHEDAQLDTIQTVKAAMKQRGFDPILTTAYLQADTKDGRSVVIPVRQLATRSKY